MAMLKCNELSVAYGQHQALDKVGVQVAPGEIVTILGANGAGKSTLLQSLAGMIPPAPGSQIMMDGVSIVGMPPHRIVEAGLALVPEGRRLFGELTVEENLLLGAFAHRARSTETEHLRKVMSLFPRLAERRRQIARTMSGGEQQMVAIGRAMMSAPLILMLDEPSLGLSPLLTTEVFRNLEEIRMTGVGILLVEQNAQQSLAVADRGYLLDVGRIVGEGLAGTLAKDSTVQEAYLGGAASKTTVSVPTVEAPAQADDTTAQIAPPVTISQPAVGPSNSASSDTLAAESIDDLVRRATQVQAQHVSASRPARPTASVAPTSGTDPDSLSRMLAEIEIAAANAIRSKRASADMSANDQGQTEGANPADHNKP